MFKNGELEMKSQTSLSNNDKIKVYVSQLFQLNIMKKLKDSSNRIHFEISMRLPIENIN